MTKEGEQKEIETREWGFSLPLGDRDLPKNGYLYSVNKEGEIKIPFSGWAHLEEVLTDFINGHLKELQEPGHFVGLWEHDDFQYIDVVKLADTEEEAIEEAKKSGQIAIYDVKNEEVIYLEKK